MELFHLRLALSPTVFVQQGSGSYGVRHPYRGQSGRRAATSGGAKSSHLLALSFAVIRVVACAALFVE